MASMHKLTIQQTAAVGLQLFAYKGSLTFYVVVSLQDSDKVQQSVEGAGAADDFEKTKPGKGAITSDYYRTFNIPERFDNPGMSHFFLQTTL